MPTFGVLTGISKNSTDRMIEVVEERLKEILLIYIENIPVDELWYCTMYPDVAEAIKQKQWPSAKLHYVNRGYFEDRIPYDIEIDEKWYLAEYGDVADAVTRGHLFSAKQHFYAEGYKEGRLPHQGWSLETASRLNVPRNVK